MKRLAMLALVLLALPVLGRAQDDNGLYFYDGKVQEIASFSLEFVKKFEHRPVLLRDSSQIQKNFFETATLQLKDGSAQLLLRGAPYQEDLDSFERHPVVNFVGLQTDQGETYVLVSFGEKNDLADQNNNPTSVTETLQNALIKALDGKFKRRTSI